MISHATLSRMLSALPSFHSPKHELEQYQTAGDIAATWLDLAKSDIIGKTVLDAGCGNGILGIGASLLGAKEVIFLDVDEETLILAEKNFKDCCPNGKAKFISKSISDFSEHVDVVLQNPPFGTKAKHADKIFLEKALIIGTIVYTMHKFSTKSFVEAVVKDYKRSISNVWRVSFPIKQTHEKHKKKQMMIDVGIWKII